MEAEEERKQTGKTIDTMYKTVVLIRTNWSKLKKPKAISIQNQHSLKLMISIPICYSTKRNKVNLFSKNTTFALTSIHLCD